ncbi:MAG: S-methyl-5-thioribose-1-phosphate isomerase [Actinomycetota bacterium]
MAYGNITLKWDGSCLKLIDQRKLPFSEQYLECRDSKSVAGAIRDMVVRGAPAIGVCAAYGVALAAKNYEGSSKDEFLSIIREAASMLAASRPTAVNLFWALKRMEALVDKNIDSDIDKIKEALESEAVRIEAEDKKINKKIGKNGITAIKALGKDRLTVLTHCNAGALATADYGTALGVIRSLYGEAMVKEVIVDETRPYLQGARLTSWELYRDRIPSFVICDNMAAYFMSAGRVDAVVVGADRIAANGDTANKIGTLGLSVLARYYRIPFFVAAPLSTIDSSLADGNSIPIEQRDGREVREVMGKAIIPDYIEVENPSFDVTGHENITGIITEAGVAYPPYTENIGKLKEELK